LRVMKRERERERKIERGDDGTERKREEMRMV
jgi:hypothetical protein